MKSFDVVNILRTSEAVNQTSRFDETSSSVSAILLHIKFHFSTLKTKCFYRSRLFEQSENVKEIQNYRLFQDHLMKKLNNKILLLDVNKFERVAPTFRSILTLI
ncbi:hypothetical protein T10_3751 [Trichinella papuae]|uniref:Uncharacterized protein n=1 Tax=Trichinella papuae TaxID=268474 RepID=A0A0V1MWS9_9BILA|nr:hypothetical protein T10_3751 [Trichinella papuae]